MKIFPSIDDWDSYMVKNHNICEKALLNEKKGTNLNLN